MRLALLLLCFIVLAGNGSAEQRVWRLGVLTPGDWPTSSLHIVMVPELARRGFVEGRNLVVLPRWGSDGDLDRLAENLAMAKPDVIVAVSTDAVRAAMTAAPNTPIVASFVDDPVKEGLATSLSRPGGKVTGVAMLAGDGDRKRFEMLHEAIPTAQKLGFLARVPNTGAEIDDIRRVAASFGVEVVVYEANNEADYRPALDAMHDARVEGVVIASSPIFFRHTAQLAALAMERRLPTICEWREMASAGCLIGYGPDIAELRLRTADFVVRLFAGGDPTEMPFEQPTHFVMAINSKVAGAIGITVPLALLARADEVIE
jgi:putative ABC transport system substrate-binding protein